MQRLKRDVLPGFHLFKLYRELVGDFRQRRSSMSVPRVASISDDQFAQVVGSADLPPCQRMGCMISFRSFEEFTR